MRVRSPLLSGSLLFLTAAQTHAVTQPHSACQHAASPLGPSAFVPLHPFLCSSPPDSSLWQAGVQQGETSRQDTPPLSASSEHIPAALQHVTLLSAILNQLVTITLSQSSA
ncbi:unnamed protein product [Pleuronectes platessa]|uniref:Uncharacterized protein n=1 Tax=Pleuronectes platessa TaxID=8262 RepID=A0A9N7UVM4_PLEPL|nr:unnamed protein product [Pleuronectes platessa]